MNKIKILVISTILLVASFVIYSCSKDDDNQINTQLEKVITFNQNDSKIYYSSKIINGRLNFSIKINDLVSGKFINEDFDINIDKTILPIEISNQISLKQQRLSSTFSKSEIRRLVIIMDNMINSVTKDMKNAELKDLKTQGLFMCNSLIKSVNRQIRKNQLDIQNNSSRLTYNSSNNSESTIYTSNSVYEGFNRELSSFALTEDLEISVDNFINYISADAQYAEEKGFLFVQEILNNIATNKISLYELESKIIEHTINNPNDFEGQPSAKGFRWPKGSDHGCCGNYSGPCYYWHPACYVHDKMCSDCTPRWFCFSGCIPD
jgi:hypothetical protein